MEYTLETHNLGSVLKDRDIVDIIVTENIERTEIKRSIGNTIKTILEIEKFRNEKIIIIPVEE